jgi:hypothetical protein
MLLLKQFKTALESCANSTPSQVFNPRTSSLSVCRNLLIILFFLIAPQLTVIAAESSAIITQPGIFPLHQTQPILWGPEWTFYNRDFVFSETADGSSILYHMDEIGALTEYMRALRKDRSGEFKIIEKTQGSITVQHSAHPNISFYVTFDTRVFEVTANPLSRKDFETFKDWFQKHLFDKMADISFLPHQQIGGGHLNLDHRRAFNGNNLLFAAFVADLIDHDELYNGVLGDREPLWAQSPADLEPVFREQMFSSILNDYKLDPPVSATSFSADGYTVGYFTEKRAFIRYMPPTSESTTLGPRLELRFIRPQKSTSEYLALIKLFEARIRYLHENDIRPRPEFKQPTLSSHYKVRRFHQYVTETGLDFEEYRNLLPKDMLRVSLEIFPRPTASNDQCATAFQIPNGQRYYSVGD